MSKAQILIVEDESIVSQDIQKRLKEMGYAVCGIAFSGEEAVEKAAEMMPNLVLMDIMLKGKLDGVEAAKQIYERFNIPVVYLTAYSDNHTLKRAEITQPFGYILKPFEERELHVAVQMALYKHKMEKLLRESEQWFATTLRCISEGVIAVDQNGLITFMNSIAEGLTGWSQQEALGKNVAAVFKLVHEETRAALEAPVKMSTLESPVVGLTEHILLIAKDGTETPVENSVAPIRDDQGNILGAVLVFRDITERKSQAAAREYQVLHDALTGLPTRTLFHDRLEQAILVGHRTGRPLALLFISLEGFEEINRKVGRYTGDLLLQQIGQRLWDTLRRCDTVARIGGYEFVVLLPGAGLLEHAKVVVQKLVRVMQEPFALEGKTLYVQIRVGVGLFPEHSEDANTLVHQAYMAMEEARKTNKDYVIYGQIQEEQPKKRGYRLFHRRPQSKNRSKDRH
jgi:diguanylate cyclase (GGDEF)-like protein/PAS domain S-box-containing protein